MTGKLRRKAGGARKVDQFTLDSTQATDQEVFLSATPSNEDTVILDLPNGTVQRKGFDFDVDGNRVFWGGLALETVLDENDKLVIEYD